MVKVRTKDATAAEKFRSYVDVRTKNWHIRRNKVAQRCEQSSLTFCWTPD